MKMKKFEKKTSPVAVRNFMDALNMKLSELPEKKKVEVKKIKLPTEVKEGKYFVSTITGTRMRIEKIDHDFEVLVLIAYKYNTLSGERTETPFQHTIESFLKLIETNKIKFV